MTSERGWVALGTISAIIFVCIRSLAMDNPILMVFACFPLGFSVVGLYGYFTNVLKVSKFAHKTGLLLVLIGSWSANLAYALDQLDYLPDTTIYLCAGLAGLGTMIIVGSN